MTLIDSLMAMTCKQFSRHVANGEEPLDGGFYRRLQFWIHWAICPFCRRYWKEIGAVGEVQRTGSALNHHPAVRLSEIKGRLKEQLIRKAS